MGLTLGFPLVLCCAVDQTRETAKQLCKRMIEAGHTVSLLHGNDMMTAERDKVADRHSLPPRAPCLVLLPPGWLHPYLFVTPQRSAEPLPRGGLF